MKENVSIYNEACKVVQNSLKNCLDNNSSSGYKNNIVMSFGNSKSESNLAIRLNKSSGKDSILADS